MRILRIRGGFQADHSSSSYLFYAVDRRVGAEGQRIARRFSSRAEVSDRSARYLKWGDSSLSDGAYEALLSEHYDLMASESYGWWTLMIAVPKTPSTQASLAPFHDARGSDDLGVDVEDFGERLVATVFCQFQADGAELAGYDEDTLEALVEMLTPIRAEIREGNTSFLRAVASFYGAEAGDVEDDESESAGSPRGLRDDMTKADLQRACEARGVEFRKSWTKDQLRAALEGPRRPATPSKAQGRPTKLSKAAREIVGQLERL